jgi:hypothetical protein
MRGGLFKALYTYMIHAINKFLEKEIVPIFFVKNSTSNLITDNTPELKNNFNSDMHWAYKLLKPGQRTNFFHYADRVNPENAKIFTYLKALNVSPQRVEFHIESYKKLNENIQKIMNLCYYLILVQGNNANPQIRPIAIAEQFARATLNLLDISKLLVGANISPTINQTRFER